MSDHDPRFVYRETHGLTVGAHRPGWTFLILDSWYCFEEVLQVASNGGSSAKNLRRYALEYLKALNDPPMCGCGCGAALPIQFPMRPHGGPIRLYQSIAHRDHHYHVLGLTA